jgi:hypothetical protein
MGGGYYDLIPRILAPLNRRATYPLADVDSIRGQGATRQTYLMNLAPSSARSVRMATDNAVGVGQNYGHDTVASVVRRRKRSEIHLRRVPYRCEKFI